MKNKLLKSAAILLTLLFLFSACVSCKETLGSDVVEEEKSKENRVVEIYVKDELEKDFFRNKSNKTINVEIKELIHLKTTKYDSDGNVVLNENVARVETAEDHGTTTFTFTILENLKFSDGKKIESEDFLSEILLFGTREFLDLEFTEENSFNEILGFSEFLKGEVSHVSGVRLHSEDSFSITLKNQNGKGATLPPLRAYPFKNLGGILVEDNGEGCTLRGEFDLKEFFVGERGYAFFPTVTSGKFVFFDSDNGELKLKSNKHHYAATSEKFAIELSFKNLRNVKDDDAPKILLGLMGSEEIDFASSFKSLQSVSHVRKGMGVIVFGGDSPLTSDINVRKGFAHLVDREEIASGITGGTGKVAKGYFSYGEGNLSEKEKIATKLDTLKRDIALAQIYFERGGFNLNSYGQPYEAGSGQIRHKRENGKLIPLIFHLNTTVSNNFADWILYSVDNEVCEQVGFEIKVIETDFETLEKNLEKGKMQLFPLVLNFGNEISYGESFDPKLGTLYNLPKSSSNELFLKGQALDLVKDNPQEWQKPFESFQKQFLQDLPILPIYNNLDHDFYSDDLSSFGENPQLPLHARLEMLTFSQ